MMHRIPSVVKSAARKGLKANENISCNNAIGVRRAKQLIANDTVSMVTVKKMFSYLSRAKTYYQPGNLKTCGTVSYLLWGGIPAFRWTKKIVMNEK